MQTILVVDDEPQILRLVRAYLEEAGFRVVTASDGEQALYVARHEQPDLIVLDILMPKMDGLEFTRRIRQERDTPIIMLTARVEETDRIVGLELGADDYVTKPFSPRELVARVRAVLRRTQAPPPPPPVLHIGPIVLDRSTTQ
jgi:two-component system alkaline phosphatase synthesis response regulator PhoP